MADPRFSQGEWKGHATTWESIDALLDDQRRLLIAREEEHRLTTYEITAPDPQDPKGDVIVAFLGNGPKALDNGPLLLAAKDLYVALERTAKELRWLVDHVAELTTEEIARALRASDAALKKARGEP